MITAVLLFGVFSVAIGSSAPFYGKCRNVTTVDVDPRMWKSEMYVNMHRYGGEYCCEYEWNSPVRTSSGNDILYNTWTRIYNGVEMTSTLHATYISGGVHETYIQDGGFKLIANFLHFEPRRCMVIYLCSDDDQFADGKDQVFVISDRAAILKEDACKIKKVLEDNQIDPIELSLIHNCGCDFIPYDPLCEGYTTPSVEDLFLDC